MPEEANVRILIAPNKYHLHLVVQNNWASQGKYATTSRCLSKQSCIGAMRLRVYVQLLEGNIH